MTGPQGQDILNEPNPLPRSKLKPLSAAEWGALRAEEAPAWSDRAWIRACAAINLHVETGTGP